MRMKNGRRISSEENGRKEISREEKQLCRMKKKKGKGSNGTYQSELCGDGI